MKNKTVILLLFSLLAALPLLKAQTLSLKKGIRIHKSGTVKSKLFQLPASSLEDPVIVVEGDNIILDFKNATLQGDTKEQLPDSYAGLAILVQNSRNVTIRNLRVRGYKVGLLAKNVWKLRLENCDFSYNYRQRLKSSVLKEDESDWLSYHQNEKDEWLRYGAGIYLSGCDSATITSCRVTGGQNGLMMTNCDGGEIVNNDFSFNSGVGIGLYRSSNNLLAHNKANFNVRGYSHGVYHRGQDSAGFLVYEQSSKNVFYKNSATHSGDGFFLWAGQTTMDSGNGGCNDNIISGNDFSYAPTNGIEVTFSRNIISRNRIFDCDHGIWGGYSYHTRIADNQFRNNRVGIAIEHGQNNVIDFNIFHRDKEAIRLWARASQPADWGYAKSRDTRSAGYYIYKNSFNSNPLVFNISRSDSLNIFGNTFTGDGEMFKTADMTGEIDSLPFELDEWEWQPPVIKNAQDAFRGGGRQAGKQNIRMGEWGPYDFRRPLAWQVNPAEKSDTLQFDMLGPGGNWQITDSKGLSFISERKGVFPTRIKAVKENGEGTTAVEITAVYQGPAFTDQFGRQVRKGEKYVFRNN